MADGVVLDPGSGGDTVAADDLGATGKVQWVKLMDGTDGGTGVIPGDATNGLDVDVTRSALPTGAATAAKQPALGTAGTASSDVITVQGIASMTAVKVDGSAVTQPVSGTVTANLGTAAVTNAGTFAVQDSQVVADNAGFTDGTTKVQPAGYVFDEVAGTALTENDAAAARIDSKRAQVLVIEDATTRGQRATVTASNALKVDASGVAVPITDNSGSLTVDNGGTFAVQDSDKVADDAAFTVGTTKLVGVGYLADQASTDSVNEGDIGAARITLDRKQIVTLAPSADTEGLSVANNIDVDETEDAVKASAGKLYGWFWYNDGASEVYIKYYNDTVANVTVGTTAPFMTIPIPAGSASNIEFSHGIAFSAAITVAATTAAATADTGAPTTNQVVGFSVYQ